MYNTPYSERMNLKGHVQGFTVGAAVVGALMLGLPMLVETPSPDGGVDEFAALLGVSIVWSEESPCTSEHPGASGCYDPTTPSLIYVSPTLNPEQMRYVVLHEIGHTLRHKLGLTPDECAADKFALSLGSTIAGYDCQ